MVRTTGERARSSAGMHDDCEATAFAEFPRSALEGSLVERFERQAAEHGRCVAIVDRGREVTYAELDAWANGIARRALGQRGRSRKPVALVLRQGAAYAAAVLGVLKSGRPYVPLDPAEPASRLRSFAGLAGAEVVLTDAESASAAETLENGCRSVLDVDVAPAEAPALAVAPDDVAYVFFTSGSTGTPKGVYDSHRNVLHNVLRYTNALRIGPLDRLTLLQGPAYSGNVSSLFCALLNGATSFPFRLDEEGITSLARWLRGYRLTVYHSVPSVVRSLAASGLEFPDVRVVRLEGDRATASDVHLVRRRFGPDCVVANGLGTTETGLARQLLVGSSDDVEDGILPVGYPVTDVDAIVVDEAGTAVPHGETGEIAVRGAYLALGYWQRPELTATAFEPVPSAPGTRLYRTGDLGRMRADGCLEYLGRRDRGLKVLGHRVEPAEVERELARVPGIRDAAVATREGRRGEGRLVAYVVPSVGATPSLAALRAALAATLPTYMLPTALVELDALPVGANGKVDRNALPAPGRADEGTGRRAGSDLERLLTEIWEDVLEVSPIRLDEEFSALGGDSLAAAEIIARLELETGRTLPASVLLGAPTVTDLATAVERASSNGASSLAILRAEGDRAPLVLVHGNTGNSLHYARLIDRVDLDRPVWAVDLVLQSGDLRVGSIAASHVSTLEAARPSGPYVLAGFCYGAVVAHEMARRLHVAGRDVSLLVLLGVTPLEFPTLLAPAALARWRRRRKSEAAFRSRLRRRVGEARSLPLRKRAPFLVRRGASRVGRAVRLPAASPPATWLRLQQEVVSHHPEPYPGRPLLVLHEADTAEYTDDPERDWAALATEGVSVSLLEGGDHAMLDDPGVERLAALLESRLGSIA